MSVRHRLDRLEAATVKAVDLDLDAMTDAELEAIVDAGGFRPVFDAATDAELRAFADAPNQATADRLWAVLVNKYMRG